MKIFFDTSILIAATVSKHPAHSRAFPWLSRARNGTFAWGIAAHSLAEMYAIFTTLPVKPRISPRLAHRIIQENIESSAKVMSLTPHEYARVLAVLSEHELAGGIIYDALIFQAALKFRADQLLTLNQRDFQRLAPLGNIRVVEV
jgi:predicted nucleic acid-binding protein